MSSDVVLLLLIFHYNGRRWQSLVYILLYPFRTFRMVNVVIGSYRFGPRVTVLTDCAQLCRRVEAPHCGEVDH